MEYWNLERLGREQLSKTLYFREFLYSEVANYYSIPNIPQYPEVAIEMGRKLAQELLEPLQDHFGRIYIRSGYRSPKLNEFCSQKGLGCKSNPKNYARHIWDIPDSEGLYGSMACIVLPSFQEEYQRTHDVKPLADWIEKNLNYSEIIFFKKLAAFNIGFHQKPKKIIHKNF